MWYNKDTVRLFQSIGIQLSKEHGDWLSIPKRMILRCFIMIQQDMYSLVKTNKALTASNLNDTIRGVTHKGICRKVRELKTIPPLLYRQLCTDVVVNFIHIYITCKPGRDKIMIKKDTFFSGVSEKEGAYIHSLASVAMIFVRYRKKHGLTQEQLAEKLGITQAMVSKIESGDYNFSLQELSGFLFDIGSVKLQLQ